MVYSISTAASGTYSSPLLLQGNTDEKAGSAGAAAISAPPDFIPNLRREIFYKDEDVYEICETQSDHASALHALLGKEVNGVYSFARGREYFVKTLLDQSLNQEIRNVFEIVLHNYLLEYIRWENAAPPSIHLIFEPVKGLIQLLQLKLKHITNQIMALRVIQRNLCEEAGIDKKLLWSIISCTNHSDLNRKISSLELSPSIKKALEDNVNKIHALVVKKEDLCLEFAKKPKFFEAYCSACQNENYHFTDSDLRLAAFVFNKKVYIYSRGYCEHVFGSSQNEVVIYKSVKGGFLSNSEVLYSRCVKRGMPVLQSPQLLVPDLEELPVREPISFVNVVDKIAHIYLDYLEDDLLARSEYLSALHTFRVREWNTFRLKDKNYLPNFRIFTSHHATFVDFNNQIIETCLEYLRGDFATCAGLLSKQHDFQLMHVSRDLELMHARDDIRNPFHTFSNFFEARSYFDDRVAISQQSWGVTLLRQTPEGHHAQIGVEGINAKFEVFLKVIHLRSLRRGRGEPRTVGGLESNLSNRGIVSIHEQTPKQIAERNVQFAAKTETWIRSRKLVERMFEKIAAESGPSGEFPLPFNILGARSVFVRIGEYYQVTEPRLLHLLRTDRNKFMDLLHLYRANRMEGEMLSSSIGRIMALPIVLAARTAFLARGVLVNGGSVINRIKLLRNNLSPADRELYQLFETHPVESRLAVPNNCFTWARRQLKRVKINLPNKAFDKIASVTDFYTG